MSNLGSLILSCHLQVAFSSILLIHRTTWFFIELFWCGCIQCILMPFPIVQLCKARQAVYVEVKFSTFLYLSKTVKHFINTYTYGSCLSFSVIIGGRRFAYLTVSCDKLRVENFHILCCEKHKEFYPS